LRKRRVRGRSRGSASFFRAACFESIDVAALTRARRRQELRLESLRTALTQEQQHNYEDVKARLRTGGPARTPLGRRCA
jgi:hypothetical protein